MAYKILNGHVILEPEMLPKLNTQRPVRECSSVKVGPKNQLVEPHARLDTSGSTFFYQTPKLWNNNVSPSQANAANINAFKRHLKI